jgi:hypothetical protein
LVKTIYRLQKREKEKEKEGKLCVFSTRGVLGQGWEQPSNYCTVINTVSQNLELLPTKKKLCPL